MKNHKSVIMIAVAVFTAISCNCVEIEQEKQVAGSVVFSGSISGGVSTKTSLNGNKVGWKSADEISINGVKYVANPKTDNTKALFKKDKNEVNELEKGVTYYAYYPYSIMSGSAPVLPDVQYYAEDDFSINPMYAESNDTTLSFKNICAVLKITVDDTDMSTVKKIRVSSANHAMSGGFTVSTDKDTMAVLTSPDASTCNVVLDCGSGKVISGSEDFYIAVPAQSYRSLKIELSSDGNDFTKIMTTNKTKDINVAVNTIYSIAFQENHVNQVIMMEPSFPNPFYPGQTYQLTTTTDPAGGAVVWESSDTTIAKVSPTGLVTAVSDGGPVTITCSSKFGDEHDSCNVTVDKFLKTSTLGLVFTDEGNNSLEGILPDGMSVTDFYWYSSDDTIASVDENGVITMHEAGEVTITCVAKDESGVSTYCNISIAVPTTYSDGGGTDFQLKNQLSDDKNNALVSEVSNEKLVFRMSPEAGTVKKAGSTGSWTLVNSNTLSVQGKIYTNGESKQVTVLITSVTGHDSKSNNYDFTMNLNVATYVNSTGGDIVFTSFTIKYVELTFD